VVFAFLDLFDPDKAKLEELKDHYRRGGLGDGELKKRLTGIMEEMIGPIREKRQQFAADPAEVERIIEKGNVKAREVAHQTLSEVRKAMGLR
jgi:tryptophanyl-tRNA synthetase